MEKIYSEEHVCKLHKSSPETVKFLLDYSKSLQVIEYKKFTFENNLN